MKVQIYILALFINLGCSGQTKNPSSANDSDTEFKKGLSALKTSPDTNRIRNLSELSTALSSDSYERTKYKIELQRRQLDTAEITVDSIRKLFESSLLHKIIPYWEDTEWSFEGHTAKPKDGTIACGYFVSTTLRDVGLKLNRYTLAQQSPLNEAKTLALGKQVVEIAEHSTMQNITAIDKTIDNGIHFIGFDASHVGYVLKAENELYLIHSNYEYAKGVEIEKMEESSVFASYDRFYIVELSTNEDLLKHWVENEQIEIIKG